MYFHRLKVHAYYSHGLRLQKRQATQFQIKRNESQNLSSSTPTSKKNPTGTKVTGTIFRSDGQIAEGGCEVPILGQTSVKIGAAGVSSVRCHLCQRIFRSRMNRDHHLSEHKQMKYKCPDPCGQMFLYYHRLQRHYREKHNVHLSPSQENSFKITCKEKKTKKRSSPLQCHLCGRKFRVAKNLKNHVQNHDKMICKCPETTCGQVFLRYNAMSRHCLSCHNKKLDKTYCGTRSPSGAKPFPRCQLCRRRFSTRSSRDDHVSNHESMRYMCPDKTCGHMFLYFKTLQDHVRTNHEFSLKAADQTMCEVVPEPGESASGRNISVPIRISSREEILNKDSVYKCLYRQCKNMFCNFASLTEHCYEAHGVRLRPYDEHLYRQDGHASLSHSDARSQDSKGKSATTNLPADSCKTKKKINVSHM